MDNLKKQIEKISSLLKDGMMEPDFFEIVRLIELAAPNASKVGHSRNPNKEVIRFAQTPYLHFPETDLDSIGMDPSGNKAQLRVFFFGMCGINGPFPLSFTEMVFQQSYNQYDHTLRRFLDLFNHRFLAFFYRAWKERDEIASYDMKRESLPFEVVSGIAGIPELLKQGIMDSTGNARLLLASSFASFKRSRDGMEKMLSRFVGLPLSVEDFVAETYHIPRNLLCQFGKHDTTALGVNMQVGRRFVSTTKKINIHFGPLDFKEYASMLPGQKTFTHICAMISTYMDSPLDYDFVFGIRTASLPKSNFSGRIALGQSIWLGKVRKPQVSVRINSSKLFEELHNHTQNQAFKQPDYKKEA